MLASNPIKD